MACAVRGWWVGNIEKLLQCYGRTLISLILNAECFIFSVYDLQLFLCLLDADKDLTYDHLAAGLKAALENDKSAFDADRLLKYTGNLASSCLS